MSALEKLHEPKDVDLSTAARGVWLVKVPKYLSEKWRDAAGTGEVGKLRINKPRCPGGKPEVVFSLSDHLLNSSDPEMAENNPVSAAPVPKDHKFVMTGITSQQLSVLAQQMDTGSVGIEGKVIQRAECRPMGDSSYMNLKKIQMEQCNKPQRELIRLDRVVQTYKPVAAHSFNLQRDARKKEEGKRARLDKDKVQDMLFAAFEKHQYYNVKDLVRITQQPITYLKEILKEICTYNMRLPHKNMWELKPEYRHYKEDAS